MEQNINKNKGLIVLVILLILCVLGLCGYIVYDKLLQKNDMIEKNTTTQTIDNSNNYLLSLNNYPKENDDNVVLYSDLLDLLKQNLKDDDLKKINSGENFDNINFVINNITFTLSCNDIDTEYNYCTKKLLNIDGKVEVFYEDFVDYDGVYIMINDKYYIIQISNGVTKYGSIIIYDKNGDELLKTDSTTIYSRKSKQTKYMTLFENKLYFIKHSDCMNILSYVDLNNSNLNVIELDSESTEGANEC